MAATEFVRISNVQPITNIEGKFILMCAFLLPFFGGQISTNVEKAIGCNHLVLPCSLQYKKHWPQFKIKWSYTYPKYIKEKT